MTLSSTLAAVSIIFSGIYTHASGGVQPSLIFLFMTSCYYLWVSGFILVSRNSGFYSVISFLFYSVLVNVYSAMYGFDTLLSGAQQFFNIIVFTGFYCYFKKLPYKSNRRLSYLLTIVIAVYFLLAISGTGRYDFEPRYNGFFNDPNQMAYWILCVVIIAANYKPRTRSVRRSVWPTHQVFQYLLGLTVIAFFNYSRSGLLGMMFLGIGRVNLRVLFFVTLVLGFIGFYYINNLPNIEVASRCLSASIEEEIMNRGLLTPFHFPEYLVFGAGHGSYARFELGHEIHSSIIGSFVFYGIPATLVFILGVLFSRLHIRAKLCFVALLAYGMTTYGFRTPIFWIAMASIISSSVARKTETSVNLINRNNADFTASKYGINN